MRTLRTYEEALREYNEECERIADLCEEEGYPRYGSNYDLRISNLESDFPEIFETEEM